MLNFSANVANVCLKKSQRLDFFSHTHTTGNATLTTAQLPPHAHSVTGRFHNGIAYQVNASGSSGFYGSEQATKSTSSAGGGQAHNHGATSGSGTLTTGTSSTANTGNSLSEQSLIQPYFTTYIWVRIS